MDEQSIRFLAIWAMTGFFFGPILLPKPKSKVSAVVQLVLCGPLAWIIFIPVSIDILRKREGGA